MMKKVIYTLTLAAAFTVGCKESKTDNKTPNTDREPISFSVGSMGVSIESESSSMAPTRVKGGPGEIMVNLEDFASSKLALYGVSDVSGTQNWIKDERVISALDATVLSSGSILFSSNPTYFPETGQLSAYSIYPSPDVVGSPVVITDDDASAPQVSVTLPISFDKQFDIIHAKTEQLTAIHAQNVKLNYEHLLSQLRFKIRCEADVKGTLTKIVVRGVNKGSMSITGNAFATSVDVADTVDFVAFQGTPMVITTTPVSVGTTPILLFPGKKIVTSVTITVDGQEYCSALPETWELAQGKVHTLTLTLKKFDMKIERLWTVSPWGTGDGYTGDLENTGRVVAIRSRMVDSTKATYIKVAPTFADIEIDGGFVHKGIPVTASNGIFTTQKFNSGLIHDEPLSLTALTLYSGSTYANASVMFSGKLVNGLTSSKQKIIIDTTASGQLTVFNGVKNENCDINITFGGFGAGTYQFPYEVGNPMTLRNVAKFPGTTVASEFTGTYSTGAHFVQIADIDLQNVLFTPLSINSGIYDGKGLKIHNLSVRTAAAAGLFGIVNSPSGSITEIRSVTLESGTITYLSDGTPGVGGIVGKLSRGRISNCINKATVNGDKANSVGGIAGIVTATGVQISGCVNMGNVYGRMSVGGIVGDAFESSEIFDCYNTGTINQVADPLYTQSFGGIAGKLAIGSKGVNVFRNCYNVGVVNAPQDLVYAGGVIGFLTGTLVPDVAMFSNLFYLNTTHTKAVGTDRSTSQGVTARTSVKTAVELKDPAIISILNGTTSVWKIDYVTPINSGYPILRWQ